MKQLQSLLPFLFLGNVAFSQLLVEKDDVIRRYGAWTTTEFIVNSSHHFENTVNVIAPGENRFCDNGKIIVMTGQPRDERRMIISDLFSKGGKINTGKGTSVTLDVNSSIEKLATDNQIVKLKNGTLIAIKLGFLWSEINPKPFWWNWYSSVSTNYAKGTRDAIFIYKSTDCGASWTQISKIDAAKIEEGQYGVPRIEDINDDNIQDMGTDKIPLWHSYGFDRQEVYCDEAKGIIYLSTQIASGKYTKRDGTVVPAIDKYGVFVSSDNGLTWHLRKESSKRVLVMTTTPNGRFFMFSVSGGKPVLSYTKSLNDYSLNSLTSVDIKYPENGAQKEAARDTNIHQKNSLTPISIARGPMNSVYMAYPVLNSNGLADYIITQAKINDNNPEVFNLSNTTSMAVKASDPNHSLGYGTLIETKAESINYLTDFNSTVIPKTLFFYVESTSGNIPASSRKAAIKGILIDHKTNSVSKDFFLSLESNDVTGRWFKPYTSGGGIGHYTKGASYIHDDKQNYIVQWPEPDGIHVSVVSGVKLWANK